MTATTIRVQMAQRKDTAAGWTAANPILLLGEIGYETDTKKFKIGDGATNWNSLDYLPIPDGSGNLTITGNLEIGSTGSLTFEGSTADGFETTLAVTDSTADRTITLPDVTGTVITTGDTGTVTSTMLADGTIVNADINAAAEIAVSKLANGTANQVLVTDGTDVSWSDNLTLAGDLTVNGTTTTINTQDLLVEDKNIIIGNVDTPTDVTADGGGITLKGSTDKTINWVDATDAWTSSERFDVPSGTAAGPSLIFNGDVNSGLYSPGADKLAISTNGTGRLFVDSTGNVGIGTASPSEALHVSGSSTTDFTIQLTNTESSTNAYIVSTGSSYAVDGVGSGAAFFAGDGDVAIGSITGGKVLQFIANGEKARIDSSGRLLVGSSSSSAGSIAGGANLQVSGTNTTQGGLALFRSFGTGTPTGTAYIQLCRNGGSNVGDLDSVASGSRLGLISFEGADGTAYKAGAQIYAEVDGTPGTNDMPGRLVLSTTPDGSATPVERMRIGNSGLMDLVAVNSVFRPTSTASAGTSFALINGKHSATAGNPNTGTTSFIVYTNGDVNNTNNIYAAISDIKLKENIVDANSQWDDLKALQVRNYNFKEGQTHTQIGLIAQEVEQVSPGLVSESPDRDKEGNDLGTVTKSVNYSVLYMKAVKALQEAMERIETLEAKVAALEAQ